MAVIRGLTLSIFEDITEQVSDERYRGNVSVHPDAHTLSRNNIRARLWVADSRDAGARRSWSGRRMRATCWHAVRDVYAEVFRQFPDARIVTGLARYNGVNGFLDNFPGTADINIGSPMQPAYMPELCDCPDWIAAADVNLTRTPYDLAPPKTRAPRRPQPVPVVRGADAMTIAPAPRTNVESSIVDDIDQLLAEVAADGWTNPYTDDNSPAKRLA